MIEKSERRKIALFVAGVRETAYAHAAAQRRLGEAGATEVMLAEYEASRPEWEAVQGAAVLAASKLAARLGQLEAILRENGLLA